jgi:hypothetical protein
VIFHRPGHAQKRSRPSFIQSHLRDNEERWLTAIAKAPNLGVTAWAAQAPGSIDRAQAGHHYFACVIIWPIFGAIAVSRSLTDQRTTFRASGRTKKAMLDDAPNRRRPVGVEKDYPECSCREIEAREIHKYEIIADRDHWRLLVCTSVLIVPTAQCRWSLGC